MACNWEKSKTPESREYIKNWSKSNPDKRRRYSKNYRNRNPEKVKRLNAKFALANPDYKREWHRLNPDYNRSYREKNREFLNAEEKIRYAEDRYGRRTKKRNRPKWEVAADAAKRRHAKRRATPQNLDPLYRAMINVFYRKAKKLTEETGVEYEVDHIYPIRGKEVCGLHVPWNLQVLTAAENLSKGNRI